MLKTTKTQNLLISVNAVYKLVGANEIREYVRSSKKLFYTPLGPPHSPKLRVNSVDEQTAMIEWITESYPRPDFVTGYRLIVNSELGQLFQKDINQFLLKDMQPGKQYSIQIATLTNSVVPQSKPSNPITLVCPLRPTQPLISQLPSVRPNSATIGWKPVEPKSNQKFDRIVSYKIMVNKKFHGEIFSTNSSSYSYMICDLVEGKFYDVEVYSFFNDLGSFLGLLNNSESISKPIVKH
ncbi:hypothetical protein BpHYR1_016864 [Brachionus plicatilis]|uniref:Fibronectin type-III domain-containing protein n=1 Tax=Brachionus plicatilis TaxID=10195 RepID=A0A3M7STS7_BRAPC|nr:hypothetical protein BpHYR1_016864 [Brachionus plicatilis]